MKQTILSNKESPLLDYAFSKLNPDVFSHPVWVLFSKKTRNASPGITDELFSAAQRLQGGNPSDSCQLMLICSAIQNHANQHEIALTTIQHVITLAKRTSLTREYLWANWGASAICIQQGNYKQASTYLDDLQSALSRENEWVLAGFVDVIKQSLFHPLIETGSIDKIFTGTPCNDLVSLTILWLQQWGFQSQASETEFEPPFRNSKNLASTQSKFAQSFFSVQHWQIYWNTITHSFREKHSLLRSSFLRTSRSNQKIKYQTAQATRQSSVSAISNSIRDEASSHTSLHPLKSSLIYEHNPDKSITVIPLTVQMLGHFSLTIQDLPIKLPASRGLSLLKYLLLHHKQDTPREVLMDVFWPDADPEAARNDLNVAMHGLRQALRSNTNVTVIRFENGAYGVVPNLEIWFDVEEFEHCIKEGKRLEIHNQLTAAITEYEIALNLYQGDFLVDTPYDSWTILDRERLRVAYLDTLDRLSQIHFGQSRYVTCVTLCQLIINRDPCREDAHCRLMRAYSRLGQGSLALRQYHVCVEALQSELEVDPEPETTQLFEQVRLHRHI